MSTAQSLNDVFDASQADAVPDTTNHHGSVAKILTITIVVAAVAAAAAWVVVQRVRRRNNEITEAELAVEANLAGLDPVAKAQVLKRAASDLANEVQHSVAGNA